MIKTIKFFLFILICYTNFEIKSFEYLQNVNDRATYRVARDEAIKMQAAIDTAERKIIQEDIKKAELFIKLAEIIISNTARFSWNIITNTSKTIQRLKQRKDNVVIGCIGTVSTLLASSFMLGRYLKKREIEKERAARSAQFDKEMAAALKKSKQDLDALVEFRRQQLPVAVATPVQPKVDSTTVRPPATNPGWKPN